MSLQCWTSARRYYYHASHAYYLTLSKFSLLLILLACGYDFISRLALQFFSLRVHVRKEALQKQLTASAVEGEVVEQHTLPPISNASTPIQRTSALIRLRYVCEPLNKFDGRTYQSYSTVVARKDNLDCLSDKQLEH